MMRVFVALPAPSSTSERGRDGRDDLRDLRSSNASLGAREIVLGELRDLLEQLEPRSS